MGHAVCHGARVDLAGHANALMVMDGQRRVSAAAVMEGLSMKAGAEAKLVMTLVNKVHQSAQQCETFLE